MKLSASKTVEYIARRFNVAKWAPAPAGRWLVPLALAFLLAGCSGGAGGYYGYYDHFDRYPVDPRFGYHYPYSRFDPHPFDWYTRPPFRAYPFRDYHFREWRRDPLFRHGRDRFSHDRDYYFGWPDYAPHRKHYRSGPRRWRHRK